MTFSAELHYRFVDQAAWTQQAQRLFIQSTGLKQQSKILEVGCGTGAFLTSLSSIGPANYFGLDIQPDMLKYAREHELTFPLSCADAFFLPFCDGAFDAVVCHFFLLWIKDIPTVLNEMRRVARPGGIIAALAEPDYGSRIEYPAEFEILGRKQRESLIHQGANPDVGRQLAEIFSNTGCINLSIGILGSFQPEPQTAIQISSEQNVLSLDLKKEMEESMFQALLQKDVDLRKKNSRVQFIPTFFCWGFNP